MDAIWILVWLQIGTFGALLAVLASTPQPKGPRSRQ